MNRERRRLINELVQDVKTDAADNGSEVYEWFVNHFFESLSMEALEEQHREAGLEGEKT